MTLFIIWYLMAGSIVGFFVNYMLVKRFKTWQALCDDFNKDVVKDEFPKLTPKVAMLLVPVICMSVFSVIWMPFLIYVGSRKS